MDVLPFKTQNNSRISNATATASVTPAIVGDTFNQLADLTKTAVEAIPTPVFVTGTVLPNLTGTPLATTTVGKGTYTQTSGGTLTLNGDVTILTWNGSTWSVQKSITSAGADSIPIALLPATPNSAEVAYSVIDLSLATIATGDTGAAMYAALNSKIIKGATVLKRLTAKFSGATTLRIYVVNFATLNGALRSTKLYQFADIPVSGAGTYEFSFTDTYVLPAGSYIAIFDTASKLYYYGGSDGTGSYRTTPGFGAATFFSGRMGYNFVTSDSDTDFAPLVNTNTGDARYSLAAPNSGTPIRATAQVKLILASTDKVLLYGDSRSSSDYPWLRDRMAALTGANVIAGGFSGYTAQQLAQNQQVQRIFDNAANLVICWIGGNDPGSVGTVGTFSVNGTEPVVPETNIAVDYNGTFFVQAISHTIRKIQAQYYDIRARAALSGTETEAQKTAKIEAVLKPYIVFATDTPQQRTNTANEFSLQANWIRKHNAIVECCNKYGVHCIDLLNLVYWDMTKEPFWPGTTDKVTNYGIYTMDGLHANKWGAEQIARIYCGQIGII